MVIAFQCKHGRQVNLKKRGSRDYRLIQGATNVFTVEILDTETEDWSAFTPRAEFRRNFRDKATDVLITAVVSWLNNAPGANKKFYVYVDFTSSDLVRALNGTWDLEVFDGVTVKRPVSESVWFNSLQTTE